LAEQCIGMHALGGQIVIEDAEHRLLHFAGVGGAADQDQLLGEVDRDHRFRPAAMTLGIGAEARQVDDGEFGREATQRLGFGAHQQRPDEQAVPGEFGDDADVDAMFGLRSAEQILDEQRLLLGQRGQEIRLQRREMRGSHAAIGVAPPHRLLGLFIPDNELVLGRSTGMFAGSDDQRPVLRENTLASAHGQFDQWRGTQVPVNLGARPDPLRVEREVGGAVCQRMSPDTVKPRPFSGCRRLLTRAYLVAMAGSNARPP
jgi:hypothetical protein